MRFQAGTAILKSLLTFLSFLWLLGFGQPAPAMSQRHSGDADVHYNPGWLQSHSVGQASLKLAILLPQPPKS